MHPARTYPKYVLKRYIHLYLEVSNLNATRYRRCTGATPEKETEIHQIINHRAAFRGTISYR